MQYLGHTKTGNRGSNMNANTQAAKAFGAIAFASGIKCAPCLDTNMMDMLKGRTVGDKRSAQEMKAWISGWTQASLSA
jgi:hypothetical protein